MQEPLGGVQHYLTYLLSLVIEQRRVVIDCIIDLQSSTRTFKSCENSISHGSSPNDSRDITIWETEATRNSQSDHQCRILGR